MAMGWLPDKKTLSYHVFILLILLEYRKRFSIQNLRLEKVMMDWELAGHSFFFWVFGFQIFKLQNIKPGVPFSRQWAATFTKLRAIIDVFRRQAWPLCTSLSPPLHSVLSVMLPCPIFQEQTEKRHWHCSLIGTLIPKWTPKTWRRPQSGIFPPISTPGTFGSRAKSRCPATLAMLGETPITGDII